MSEEDARLATKIYLDGKASTMEEAKEKVKQHKELEKFKAGLPKEFKEIFGL